MQQALDAAMLPMALGITGHGGFISQPLALVGIRGLLSSTVLTQVVLPTLYNVVEERQQRSRDSGTGPVGTSAAVEREAEPVPVG